MSDFPQKMLSIHWLEKRRVSPIVSDNGDVLSMQERVDNFRNPKFWYVEGRIFLGEERHSGSSFRIICFGEPKVTLYYHDQPFATFGTEDSARAFAEKWVAGANRADIANPRAALFALRALAGKEG